MSAYLIFIRNRTTDAASLDRYLAASFATIAGHPVRPLTVFGEMEVLEGPDVEGVVILEFPDRDAAHAWYDGDAYQAAAIHRRLGADYGVLLVDGTAPPQPAPTP